MTVPLTFAQLDLPRTLRPARWKTVLFLLVCLAFAGVGIAMIGDGRAVGYFCAIVFGLGAAVFAVQLHPRAAYLRLERDGFTFCSLFRAHQVRWAHVEGFALIRVGPNRMIGWNFRAGHVPKGRTVGYASALSGYQAALPDTYGMKGEELVWLLNALVTLQRTTDE